MMTKKTVDPKHDAFATVRRHRRHKLKWALCALVLFVVFLALAPIWRNLLHSGIQRNVIEAAGHYLSALTTNPSLAWRMGIRLLRTETTATLQIILAGGLALGLLMFWRGHHRNPHSNIPPLYGDAAWATDDTIKEIEARQPRQASLSEDKWLYCLGRWEGGKNGRGKIHKNEILQLSETLSCLAFAPPGSFKTAGLIVPSIILTGNDRHSCSMLIHDPKGELFNITSNWRSRRSIVIKLDWSALDRPDRHLYHARWNPISVKTLPPIDDPRLPSLIDAAVQILIPDADHSGERYFLDAARNALIGAILFLMWKVNVRKNYDGIPAEWRGQEASLPMLVDWMSKSQYESAERRSQQQESLTEDEIAKQLQKFGFNQPDPLTVWFQELVKEADEHHYDRRAFNELQTLARMADKQRSGVLGEIDRHLSVFKLPEVKQRTSTSDFAIEDLRGKWDNRAKSWQPLTIYLSNTPSKAKTYAKITTLFLELVSKMLLDIGPNHALPDGRAAGPLPVSFILDEFAKLEKTRAIVEGPDLGRGKAVSYLFGFQDLKQLEIVYSAPYIETLITTASIMVVYAQNNEHTSNRIRDMIGKTTIRKRSHSYARGIGAKSTSTNVSEAYEGVDLVTPDLVMSIPPDRQIVLVQGFRKNPLWLKTVPYWLAPETRPYCYNDKNPELSPPGTEPAPPIPEWMTIERMHESDQSKTRQAAE